MTIDEHTSLRALSFIVCTALDHSGTTAVLTGGSAAVIHAPEAIQSFDADFIIERSRGDGAAEKAIETLGFVRDGDLYRHGRSKLLLEFPPGPLMVGDDRIRTWSTLRDGAQLLHVLSPTDSCRDRLAAYFFWRDRRSLLQAVAVARACEREMDLARITAWAKKEGRRRELKVFLDQLSA